MLHATLQCGILFQHVFGPSVNKEGNAWGDCMLNADGISMFEGISPLSDNNI